MATHYELTAQAEPLAREAPDARARRAMTGYSGFEGGDAITTHRAN